MGWETFTLPLLMGALAELVPWGCLGMGEPSNPRGEPGQILGARHGAGGCHGAGGHAGFWGQSQVGGDLGEPVLDWVRWADGIPGAAECPGGGGLAASSFPSPVCGQRGDEGARAQVPRPEPGPELRALSPGVPSPLAPSPGLSRSWSPLALQSCSQRERGQDTFPKDQG